MVTASGWAYPDSDSTGYADTGNISKANGWVESTGQAAAILSPGDSVNASSTLYQTRAFPDPQHLVVTIEMPNGELQSRSFTVDASSYVPPAVAPSRDTSS
jgi:hypothetical protein